jgi:signal transduction protein with GAF and PtsI domain
MATAPPVPPGLQASASLIDDLQAAVRATRRFFAAAACSCALVTDAGDALVFVAADGEGAAAIVGVSIPVSKGVAGWAAMTGQPIAVRDVQTDARFARDVAESTNYVPSSILAAPMMTAEGEVMGVTSVLDPSVEEASDWTLQVLGTLASQLALLLAGGHGPSTPSPTEALGRDVLRVVDAWQAGQPGHVGPSGTRAPGAR